MKSRNEYSNPALNLRIRGSDDDEWKIVNIDTGHVIDVLSSSNAVFTIYEQSVFLVGGKTFFVKTISHENRLCLSRQMDLPYITFSRDYTDVNVIAVIQKNIAPGIQDGSGKFLRIETFYGEVEGISSSFIYRNQKLYFMNSI